MTYRDRSEHIAPDDLRCDALVRSKRGWPDWARVDHRCPRCAQQSRAAHSVCYTHAIVERVEWWSAADAR